MTSKRTFYSITLSQYESSEVYQFQSESRKTQEEFKKDFQTILIKYADEIMIKHKSLSAYPDCWFKFASEKLQEFGYFLVASEIKLNVLALGVEDKEFVELVGKDISDKALKLGES